MTTIISNSFSPRTPAVIDRPFSFEGGAVMLASTLFSEMQAHEAQKKNPSITLSSQLPASPALITMISSLVETLKGESKLEIAERELLRKIHQLSKLLTQIDICFKKEDALKYLQQTLDGELYRLLCDGVAYAVWKSEDRYGYAQKKIEENPTILLQIVTPEGDNLVKKLISELEEIGKNKQCLSLEQSGHLSQEKLCAEIQTRMKIWGQTLNRIEVSSYALGIQNSMNMFHFSIFETMGEIVPDLNLPLNERIELANVFVEKEGYYPFVVFIDRFQLPQEERLKFFNQMLEKDRFDLVAEFIEKFELPGNVFLQFMHQCFVKHPETIAVYLHKFPLSQEEQIALSNILVEQGRTQVLANSFGKFNLPAADRERLTAICLEKAPGNVSFHIEDFPSLNEKQRFDLARAQDHYSLRESIQRFNLPEPARYQLIQRCVERDWIFDYNLSSYLANFALSLEHQQQLAVQLADKKGGNSIPEWLHKFKDLPEEARYQLAQMYVQTGPDYNFLETIPKFSLSSEHLTELLVVYAAKYPHQVSKILPLFSQSNPTEATQFKLALIYLKSRPYEFTQQIRTFHLNSEHLRELAFALAEQSPEYLIASIDSFKITDETTRLQLIKSCVISCKQGDLLRLFKAIGQLTIASSSARAEVCRLFLQRDRLFADYLMHAKPDEWTINLLSARLNVDQVLEGSITEKLTTLQTQYGKDLIAIGEQFVVDCLPYAALKFIKLFPQTHEFLELMKKIIIAKPDLYEEIQPMLQREDDSVEIIKICIETFDKKNIPFSMLWRVYEVTKMSKSAQSEVYRCFDDHHCHLLTEQFVSQNWIIWELYLAKKYPEVRLEPIAGADLEEQNKNFCCKYATQMMTIAEEQLLDHPASLLNFLTRIPRSAKTMELLKKAAARKDIFSHSGFTELKLSAAQNLEIVNIYLENATSLTYMDLANIAELNIQERSARIEICKSCCRKYPHSFLSSFLHNELYKHDPWFSELLEAYIATTCPNMGFEQLLVDINKTPDLYAQTQQCVWLAETFLKMQERSPELKQEIGKREILNKILHLPLPDIRPLLADRLIDAAIGGTLTAFTVAATDEKSKESMIKERLNLLMLFYQALKSQSIPQQSLDPFWDQITSRFFLVNTSHFRQIIIVLNKLFIEERLNPNEKAHVMDQLVKQATLTIKTKKGKEKEVKGNDEMVRALASITAILEFDEARTLINPKESYISLVQQVFKKHIPISDVPDFLTKYNATFGSSRYPEALIVFAGRMRRMGPRYLESLARFTRDVLMGEFPASRYRVADNPHLKSLTSEILEQWKTPVASFPVKAENQQAISPTQWLMSSLEHRHLPLDLYPYLKNLDSNFSEENRQKLLVEINEELKKSPNDESLQVQRECLLLIDPNNNNCEHSLRRLQDLLSKTSYEFLIDIKGFLESLQPNPHPISVGLFATQTDDPYILFNCGKDVYTSCQRWDGDYKLCCGLLGYLQHGQTQLLANIDREGKIASRAILRMLLDEDNNPVLFLEKFYPNNASKAEIAALVHLAEAKQAQMQIPLTTTAPNWPNKQSSRAYPKGLRSLGGPAPAEYCDAAVGNQSDGKFMINKVYYLEKC